MQQNNFSNLYLKNDNSTYDYSKFLNLDDFTLDDELIEKFTPVAKELNLTQQSVETLLDLALEMSKKQNSVLRQDSEFKLKQDIESYKELVKKDEEIPNFNSEKIKAYMKTADIAYDNLVSDGLKEIFNNTGLIYHPELIKMFHNIGELMEEDGINYFGSPQKEELSPAEILYGKKENYKN